ncbi:glycosyltransferase family 2 protein [Candidatus Methylobacter oryzae]|uniref:Glycosyltransferase n=1 Tax=Candidatus Methylobacter oryzae TaxID=2497749 RepID=A0ABY3CES1_9GAMM|nr:glycosyltransferase family 2 protein [Candidatus Methylobacter oryzae]TRX01782.1 glycosyltransferase [Candidatus Methylobacter oryzae]
MKISIVTISYNQVQYLEKAIRSIIDQDFDDLEYIVVDPGSNDGSRDIIEKYRSKITQILYEPDKGPADGLNNGFRLATGDIFGFINADDELLPGALQKIAGYFEQHPQIDVACGSGYIIDKTGVIVRKIMPTRYSKRLAAYGAVTFIQQGTFFSRSAFYSTAGFNINNRTCWDGELLLDMAINVCKFGAFYQDIAAFRIYDSSISGSGRLNALYQHDCNRLFSKAMGRPMNFMDKLLMKIYLLEKWITNPAVTFNRILDIVR